MSEERYVFLVQDIHELIMSEMKQGLANDQDISILYPKLVIMYEFFRLLRGESFVESRPSMSNFQRDLYKMEDEIRITLDLIKSKINFSDEKLQHEIKQIGVPYFEV